MLQCPGDRTVDASQLDGAARDALRPRHRVRSRRARADSFSPAPHLAIDPGVDETMRDRRAEKQVVDAQSGVARPGISDVVPKGVDALVWVKCAQSVGPALRNEIAEDSAHLRSEQGVVDPALRLVDVELG